MIPSTAQLVVFYLCAAVTLVGAISTVLARNPIRGAMGLLLTIGGIAALFLTLHAEFLAIVQLLVYAGAVVVLFLFVIMLLGPASQPPSDSKGLPTRVLAALGMLAVSGCGIAAIAVSKLPEFVSATPETGTIESMSKALFGPGLIPFELSSGLLMVAVVGAVAIARGKHTDPTRRPLLSTKPPATPAE